MPKLSLTIPTTAESNQVRIAQKIPVRKPKPPPERSLVSREIEATEKATLKMLNKMNLE